MRIDRFELPRLRVPAALTRDAEERPVSDTDAVRAGTSSGER